MVPVGKHFQIREVKQTPCCFLPQHSIVWPHSTGRDGHKREAPPHLTSHIWEQLLPWYPHCCIPERWPPGWGTLWKCEVSVEMSHFPLLCSEAEELCALVWAYLLVTLPPCLSWSGPEVVKKHLFPGLLNNSVSWPKVWSGWDAHFALCSGALPGSPTHCKTPALRRFADHVSLLAIKRDEIPSQAGIYWCKRTGKNVTKKKKRIMLNEEWNQVIPIRSCSLGLRE